MKKRIVTFVAIFIVLLVGIYFLIDVTTPETYTTAKKSSEKFLKSNFEAMEEIAIDLLSEEKEASGHFKEHYYAYRLNDSFVTFEIDAQGMLGGQYWSLIYTKDGTYCGESEKYLYQEPDGNNVIIADKLDNHWWFYWIDYDGTDRSHQ